MRFAYPAALLLALPVIGATAWLLRRLDARLASLIFPAEPQLWSKPASPAARLARFGPPALTTAALLLLVTGLARPQKVTSRLQGLGQGIDIMMALDTSTSMSAIDFNPLNRLDAAIDTSRRFIAGRVQDRIGMIVFGGAPQLAAPLTLDYDALSAELGTLTPGMTHVDGTAIGDGIISAANHLKDGAAKSRIIILLTDGRSNTGLIDPITAAKTAASLGIKIYTIGCAKRGQALMPVDDPLRGRMMVPIDDDLDEDLLTELARTTDGRYFRATSLQELRDIYATIDKLEKTRVKLPDIVSRNDLYQYPVLAAALLLLLEALLANTWLLRWP